MPMVSFRVLLHACTALPMIAYEWKQTDYGMGLVFRDWFPNRRR